MKEGGSKYQNSFKMIAMLIYLKMKIKKNYKFKQ